MRIYVVLPYSAKTCPFCGDEVRGPALMPLFWQSYEAHMAVHDREIVSGVEVLANPRCDRCEDGVGGHRACYDPECLCPCSY